ncbi:MAG: hypothetical protein AB2A00_09470 [Myxococcota bacterium]
MRVGFWLCLCGVVTVAPGASAFSNDVDMSGLAKWEGNCDPFGKADCQPAKKADAGGTQRVQADQEAFDGLVEELAVVMAPRDVDSARTPGQAGFDVGLDVTLHHINNHHDYWARSLERSARKGPKDLVYPYMGTAQATLKKGLPYSLEIGAGLTYLMESRIFGMGVLGKWTLNEGFFWLPDIALTGSASHVLCVGLPTTPPTGNSTYTTLTSCGTDLNMITASGGLVISKSFAFLGMFTLTPYAGWQKVFVHAFGPVVDSDESNNDRTGDTFQFRDYKMWGDFVGQRCGEADAEVTDCFLDKDGTPQLANLFTHRNKLYAGLRFHFSVLQALLQTEVTHVRGTRFDVASPTLRSSNSGISDVIVPDALQGVTTPDLQYAATLRVGLLF